MKLRKKNTDLLLFFVVSLVVSIIVLYLDRDFGVNLVTEIIGVAITVFVINKIIERRERQRRVSIDQRILRDIQVIIASYFSIWKHLAWTYMPDRKIKTNEEFLQTFSSLVIASSVKDRFTIVSLQHPESWELFFNNKSIKDCFINYHAAVSKQIESFINDYKIYIDPELFDLLMNILELQYFKDIQQMGQDEIESALIEYEQDPTKLESYISPDDNTHVKQFIELFEYSTRLKMMVNKFTDSKVEIYDIKEYFVNPHDQFPYLAQTPSSINS